MTLLVHEEMGFEFSSVLMEAQKGTHLAEDLVPPCRMVQMNVRSSHQMGKAENDLVVDYQGTSKAGQGGHAVEIDPKQDHLGQSGTHARVAIVRTGQNGGHWGGGDALVHGDDSFPGLDSTLDPCASPCRGDHGDREGLGRRSTDLSAPDSYGIQP